MVGHSRDILITEILKKVNFSNGIILYNIITLNYMELLITLISIKLGISKLSILLIMIIIL